MKFQFLKSEWLGEREFAYVMDTETGDVFRSEVKTKLAVSSGGVTLPSRTVMPTPTAPRIFTAPGAERRDPDGERETPEERTARIGNRKVPPAFLGDTRRMMIDPAKHEGMGDVTPHA